MKVAPHHNAVSMTSRFAETEVPGGGSWHNLAKYFVVDQDETF